MFDVSIRGLGVFIIDECPAAGLQCIDWRRQNGLSDSPNPTVSLPYDIQFNSEEFVRRYPDLANGRADIEVSTSSRLFLRTIDGKKDIAVGTGAPPHRISLTDAKTIIAATAVNDRTSHAVADVVIRAMTNGAIRYLASQFDLASQSGRQEMADAVNGCDCDDHPALRFGKTWPEWAQCICERWDALQEGIELPG